MGELLRSDFEVVTLLATNEFFNDNGPLLKHFPGEQIETSEKELDTIGSFQSNTSALAVAKMKPNQRPSLQQREYVVVLDDIRDPGNMGTIIRTADWYGIRNIIASEETADFYNPKVISASMGSFCRMNVFYTSLEDYLSPVKMPVYGTFLDGENIHQVAFESEGLIVIGNEANGISSGVAKFINHKITIPRFGEAESLNAGIATAIVLDNLFRSKK